ncbi:hypothetical protein Tco_0477623 [Tanacetum coccineum]
MHPATAPLIGFNGEIVWPLGQLSLLVKIRDEEHSTSAWMNFVVVRSSSPYNRIIGRPRVKKIQAVPSTTHGILKFPIAGGVLILRSSKIIPIECAMVSRPEGQPPTAHQAIEERIKPEDMTGIPRHVVEHRLNIWEGCPLIRFPFKCFLDAYKRYHQIKMAKEDEEKTPFITSQGVFCYSKMPFGLRNAGATYQHLVDKAFHKQIDRNLEGRRWDVPRLQGQYQRNKGMPRQSRCYFKSSIFEMFKGRTKAQWKPGKLVGIKRLLDDIRVTAAQRKDKDRKKDKDWLEIKSTYVISISKSTRTSWCIKGGPMV